MLRKPPRKSDIEEMPGIRRTVEVMKIKKGLDIRIEDRVLKMEDK
jgi:hypothetical protein